MVTTGNASTERNRTHRPTEHHVLGTGRIRFRAPRSCDALETRGDPVQRVRDAIWSMLDEGHPTKAYRDRSVDAGGAHVSTERRAEGLTDAAPAPAGDALLIIDVQRDFCPGGAYPVPDGDAVVPVLNEWIAAAREKTIPVFATRDWHPADHVSFSTRGGRLPPHSVQGTPGAAFHPGLRLPPDAVIISKGTQAEVDADSAFAGTDLAPRLRDAHVRRLWVGGLALDDAVRATVLDALKHEFTVEVIAPATRARVIEHPADSVGVFEQLQQAGAFVGGRHAPSTAPEPA